MPVPEDCVSETEMGDVGKSLKKKVISQEYFKQFASMRDVTKLDENGVPIPTAQDDPTDDTSSIPPSSFFVPDTVSIPASEGRNKVFLFKLNLVERIFLTLHRPNSSPFSKWCSNFMVLVIVVSCAFFVISSDPDVRSRPSSCSSPVCKNDPALCPGETICEPIEPYWFFVVELTCVTIFTVDYVIRIALVAFVPPRLSNIIPQTFDSTHAKDPLVMDPVFSKLNIIYRYMIDPLNIIDLVAIMPFFVGLMTNTQSSVSVIRILRLGRMMRVFKVGKYSIGSRLLAETIRESLPALSLLCFFTLLLVVLFGSLVFFAEGGLYTVSVDFPEGAYLRPNLLANGQEESPFRSILMSCWWVIVTMTTVGYGDLYPTTAAGRLIGVCCMLVGILALALPIGVMGSSFNRIYSKFHGKNDSQMLWPGDTSQARHSSNGDVGGLVCELNDEVVIRTDEECKNPPESDVLTCSSSPHSSTGSSVCDREQESSGSETVGADLETDLEERSSTRIKDNVEGKKTKLSNKEICRRLHVLSDEISALMAALDDADDDC